VTKATLGLAGLGVDYQKPKVGKLRRYKSQADMDYQGNAYNDADFSINVITQPRTRQNLIRKASEWSSTIVHEVVHCARMEHILEDRFGLLESNATEGLAYVAEHLYITKFCGKQVCSMLFEHDLEIDPMLESEFKNVSLSGNSSQAHRRWSEASTRSVIPNGALYGAQRVYQQLNDGRSIAELISRPAEEVLGL
jgi:hypothetical protein